MEILEFLSRRAGNPTEKVELMKLANDYNAYNSWRKGWPGMMDLFKQFPSIQVDSADIASRLPAIQPRFYSIASSFDFLNSKKIEGATLLDLLIHVVEYPGESIWYSFVTIAWHVYLVFDDRDHLKSTVFIK